MDKKTKYRLERGKEMTSRLVRVFEGGMVVMILLAIAVAVTPRISRAQTERQVSVLVNRLQRVRARIAVYRAEHDGVLPGQETDGQSVSAEDFTAALTGEDQGGLGPYLDQIPANPFVMDQQNQRTVTVVNHPAARPTGLEGTGWWFNAATGHFTACDSRYHAAY